MRPLDYPNIPHDRVVIWDNPNGFKWPDGRRETWYLSKTLRDPMWGQALWTSQSEDALTFDTIDEARAFFVADAARRPFSHSNVMITTITDLIKEMGFPK